MKQLFFKNTKLNSKLVSVLDTRYKHSGIEFKQDHVPNEHFSAHYKTITNYNIKYTQLEYQLPEGLFVCPADVRFLDFENEYTYGRITMVVCRFNSFLKYKGVYHFHVTDEHGFVADVSPFDIEFLPKRGYNNSPIEVGDQISVWRNQNWRDGEVLSVNDQEALIEYEMEKSGAIYKNIVNRHNTEVYRSGAIPKSLQL